MNFKANQFYHIYNRGNNGQPIFFEERNYAFFLRKMQKELTPYCSILAYCLMPNHYHILIYTDISRLTTPSGLTTTVKSEWSDHYQLQKLPRKLGTLQSSYTRAINNFYDKTGSLFQQKANAKNLSETNIKYLPETCFHYIHQNPLRAGLVESLADYPWSSFKACQTEDAQICDIRLSKELLSINFDNFDKESYQVIRDYHLFEH